MFNTTFEDIIRLTRGTSLKKDRRESSHLCFIKRLIHLTQKLKED